MALTDGQFVIWTDGIQTYTVAENTVNNQYQAADKGWYFSLESGRGINKLLISKT